MDINDLNIEPISLSDKHCIGKNSYKYFVGYINYEIASLLIKMSKEKKVSKKFSRCKVYDNYA